MNARATVKTMLYRISDKVGENVVADLLESFLGPQVLLEVILGVTDYMQAVEKATPKKRDYSMLHRIAHALDNHRNDLPF